MKPLPVIQPSAFAKATADKSAPAPAGGPPQAAGMVNDPAGSAALRPQIVKALSTVFDPEIPVNIYELGLIYDVIVDASSAVGIRMTLTAPACPAAQFLPEQVKKTIAAIPGVTDVNVDVVWDPPWDRSRMSDAAKLQLGMF
jgi:FeS assembly SUF system protein